MVSKSGSQNFVQDPQEDQSYSFVVITALWPSGTGQWHKNNCKEKGSHYSATIWWFRK